MTQATNVQPGPEHSTAQRHAGNGLAPANGHGHANGNGYSNGPVAAAPDPLRVDVQSARRQSSQRRRPTLMADGADADPDGLVAEDPTGGAFEQTLSMSGRTPPSPKRPAGPNQPAADAAPVRPAAPPEPQVVPRAPSAIPRAEQRPVHIPGAAAGKPAPMNRHVCPFCGTKRDAIHGECPSCGMPDNDESRAATVARVGPWFVLQQRNPSAPGMRFNVLRELVRAGQITAGSIVRGPTTHQLWTYAARVRGLAYLFGICWSCNRRLPKPQPGEEADDFCVFCGALQEAPANPDQQLEAFTTTESLGTGVSNLAGQVARGGNGGSGNGGSRGHAGTVTISQHARAPSHPRLPRKPHTPRPLPPAPKDGGDALLTTRELATAFNLDRRHSVMSTLGRIPWLKMIAALVLAALLVAAIWIASTVLWEPIARALGIPAQTQSTTATEQAPAEPAEEPVGS